MTDSDHATGARTGSTPLSEEEINMHLGRRMRKRRKLLGLTQQEVGNASGVAFQQIQKYESGANRMSAARLWQIARVLEVPVNHFYGGLGSSQLLESGHLDPQEADALTEVYSRLGVNSRLRLFKLAQALAGDMDSDALAA